MRAAEFFGGPERAIIGQCLHLPQFEFICAAFVRGNPENEFLIRAKEAGLKTTIIRDNFAGDFRVIRQIRDLIKEHQADLLIGHDYKANFFGRQAVKKLDTVAIAHFRGYTWENKKVKIYNALNAWLLRRMPLVLTVSEKSRDILIDMGVQSDKIRVVPNAVEKSKMVGPDFVRSINENEPLKMVCAGRLSYEKGYDILLDALAQIKSEIPPFIVEIYGHGPEQENLRQQTERLGLTDCVFWRGFTDDIISVLRTSDLLLLPSRTEGMPNVLLEAWAQKLGVVSAAVGGVPEMMQHHNGGWLVKPDDSADLAVKIKEAVADRQEIIDRGQRGYRTVTEIYSYEKQEEILDNIYKQAARAGKLGEDISGQD